MNCVTLIIYREERDLIKFSCRICVCEFYVFVY
uniref:Uncharacterized protein n=1 Tax=Wuchereria bancrofti TaxID=6293 RepID=A0AAF5RXQ9_WUCBA